MRLQVVSQERKLLDTEVDSITAPATEGEITILARHIPLFTTLSTGELRYVENGTTHTLVVSQGFLTISPQNEVTVMVDSAVLAREISVQKAQEAIDAAQETMKYSQDRRELIMAEASLRRAMLEIKVAQKYKSTTV